MKVGTDIVEVCRFFDKIDNQKFVSRLFSKREIEHIFLLKNPQNISERMAGKFACKEAFLKALGIGISKGISLFEIEILPDKLGAPHIFLTGKTKEIFDKLEETNIEISISHTKDFAQSICIFF